MDDMLETPLLFAPAPLGNVHSGRANYSEYADHGVLQVGLAQEMRRHDEFNASLNLVGAIHHRPCIHGLQRDDRGVKQAMLPTNVPSPEFGRFE